MKSRRTETRSHGAERQPLRYALSPARRGAVIILAMVCLIIVSAVGSSLVKSALLQRRQVIRDQQRHQAEWLAQAGLERAAAILQSNPEYTGDGWTVPLESQAGKPGHVAIRVEAGDRTNHRTITVVAESPRDADRGATITRRIDVDLDRLKPATPDE